MKNYNYGLITAIIQEEKKRFITIKLDINIEDDHNRYNIYLKNDNSNGMKCLQIDENEEIECPSVFEIKLGTKYIFEIAKENDKYKITKLIEKSEK